MAHSHHHEHGHSHSRGNERKMLLAAVLTGGFMVAEVIGGIVSGSLALLADAAHMLTDFAALALAWLAFRFSRWPADRERTYGFDRLQVLVAYSSGLSLFAIAAVICYEAIHRLNEPVPVAGGTMMVVAAAGLAINLIVFAILHSGDRDNLNMRAATVHVLADMLGSVGAIAAAGVILTTGWIAADPLASILVALMVLYGAWNVVRDSAHILLEATPKNVAPAEIEADLEANIPEIEDVHHVHAWSITQERPMVTLHARLCEQGNADAAIHAIKTRLRERFGVAHATVEIEFVHCADGHAHKHAH
ncbi:MAG TPA: cation diffusion facilitator family transporter [Xanthobacteraceae bacterium]|nr:cation diffusion facilitator family transporter [Xanthobacteraceae bacterium]